MKFIKWLIIAIVGIIVLAVVVFFFLVVDVNPAPEKLEVTQPNDTTLRVKGAIDAQNANSSLDAIKNNPKLETIVVTSGGGTVSSAVDIAKEIYQRKLKLEVEGYCMSSCFN